MDPIAEGRRNWVAYGCGPVEQVTAATALTRAQQIATRRMAPVLATCDLTFAQLEVLIAVAGRDQLVGMGELGAALGLHPTTTARTVARLERARYVERVDDAEDRRVTRVRASERGTSVAQAALARLGEIRFGLEGWDEAETRRFACLAGLICDVGGTRDREAFAAASALIRSAGAATARIDHLLRGFGLTFARYEVLLLLSWTRSGSMPLGRMRDRLLIHQAAVTNLVDRLEADGLVRRVPHTRDRRTTLAEITSQGRKVVIPATRQIAAQLRLGISDEQAEEVFALVQKLRKSAGEIA
ncbi:MAG TPA: MarR family transcriptional regulator [Streptosporangiaceae bacterium]|nr:MarR family transcriptional regulator [Streptosporangiaceae bacterium]